MFLFKIEILNFFILSQVILDFKHTYICVFLKMKIKKPKLQKPFGLSNSGMSTSVYRVWLGSSACAVELSFRAPPLWILKKY